MAYDFPPSPFTGQVYAGWSYDGEKWLSTTATPNTAGVIAIQVFTASGIYVPSPSMTTAVIECQAGGGGGGGAASQAVAGQNAAGGGGGGSYSRKFVTAAQIGSSQNVTVGAAGAGGAAGNNNGIAGGNSSVGTLCTTNGGLGGIGVVSAGNGTIVAGGAVGTGDFSVRGGAGSQGFPNILTTSFPATGGYGGNSVLGVGGPSITTGQPGNAGSGYGSGGSGGSSFSSGAIAQPGGNGSPGIVVITEYGMTALASTAGQGNVRYDLPQGLSASQKAQARANIDSLKKNYIINGTMRISQENGATVLNALGGPLFPVDMFGLASSYTGTATVAQVASLTPGGSPNRLRFTVTAADASVGAGDIVQIIHAIEGFNIADLKSGTAAAKQVTLQFGVKGPAGIYGVSFGNSAANRTYVAEYTIAAGEANTDVVKTVTLTLDTTGMWLSDNGRGLDLRFFLMGGTNYQTATPNTWLAGAFYCTANQFNIMGTNGNVFELFDVGLYEGAVAPAFQVPDFVSELQVCQRYFETIMFPPSGTTQLFPAALLTTTFWYAYWPFHVRKRVAPTFALGPGIAWVTNTPTVSPSVDGTLFNNSAGTFYIGAPGSGNYVGALANARL